jgi:hypothetical protein
VKASVVLERVAIVVASLALSFGLIAVLSGFFAGRDQAGVSGTGTPVGEAFRDLGAAHLSAGELHPAYDSNPPTSGAHVPAAVDRDERPLSDDQLLEALELGDVVIFYGTGKPPPGLVALADAVAGPFSPALASSGLAVILAPRAGTIGLTGVAWAHLVSVRDANAPLLRQFAEYWLGRGAPGH